MKKFFLLSLLPFFLFAQFTKNDEALIKTTFQKTYDKKIIASYLNSHDKHKVDAALLSITSSEDTNFVSDIIKLDFRKYGGYMAFALGQIGPCKKTAEFLSAKILSGDRKFREECLEALGKTASQDNLKELIEFYLTQKKQDWTGISLCMLNFFNRNIKSPETTAKIYEILKNEYAGNGNSEKRITDALFVFYRMGGSPEYKNDLIKLIENESIKNESIKQHLFASLRRLNYFPADQKLYKKALTDISAIVRIEAAKLLVFYNHTKKEELQDYIKLVTDKNPNVSRQAAISVQGIKCDSLLKPYIKTALSDILDKRNMPANTNGEILKSLVKLFPGETDLFYNKYKNSVRSDFIYEITGDNYKDIKDAVKMLLESYNKESLKNRVLLSNIILSLPIGVIDSDKLADFIVAGLNSGDAAITATFAEGTPDTLLPSLKEKIMPVIEKQIKEKYKSADFYEAAISLAGLAKKISEEFYNSMIQKLSESPLYSIKKYVAASLKKPEIKGKDVEVFTEIFNAAFKYKGAKITTDKGTISIVFKPEFAPVSVGNFCYLASKGYYDNNMFHRVVPGFVIQAGDPTETGFGGPGHEIITEPVPLPYIAGRLGMASAGKDTEGSQWFIMQGYHPHLNGRYSLFAEVKTGMETVLIIDQIDKVKKIELIK